MFDAENVRAHKKLHSKEKKKNILFTAMTQKHSLCHQHRHDDDSTPPQLKKKNYSEMFTIHYFIIDGQILLYFTNNTEVCYIYIPYTVAKVI